VLCDFRAAFFLYRCHKLLELQKNITFPLERINELSEKVKHHFTSIILVGSRCTPVILSKHRPFVPIIE
jgi:hypothetical protein